MDKIYFVTDLDRTIIHAKNKGYKCVEKIENREITYMTEKSYKSLIELLKIKNFKFIPCTMRSLKQTMRVDFIREYNPEIVICCNGGQVYLNGELDNQWNEVIESIVDNKKLLENINILEALKDKYKDDINIIEVRNIENLYIEVKSADIDEGTKFYNIIKNYFEDNLEVIQIKSKIFIIHKRINKIAAVDYIVDKYGIKNLITSGDSIVDEEFTKRGISILPKHASFRHNKSIITEKEGIYSTEEIIEKIKDSSNIC